MPKRRQLLVALISVLVMLSGARLARAGERPGEIVVFSAVSLQEALHEISDTFRRQGGGPVRLHFAGSSTLRMQIEKGAEADVFLSADTLNVKQLEAQRLMDTEDAFDFLSNRLAVIAPAGSPVRMSNLNELPDVLNEYLAIADPGTVPAGVYAKEVLVQAGLWDKVAHAVVPALDVRAALALVAGGQADLGIVYLTDARTSSRVKVIYAVPEREGVPVRYRGGILSDAPHRAASQKFISFLRSEAAQAVFRSYGFDVL